MSNSVKMGTYCSVGLWEKTVRDQIQMVEHSRWLSRVLMYRKLIMFRQCITGSVWPWWMFLQKHPSMYHSCKIMFRLMTGEHGLGSTIGLWHGKNHSKIWIMCDLHMVETVQHILIECPSGRDRCNRLRCPLARMSGLQCFNMGHNGRGINLYGVSMTLMEN